MKKKIIIIGANDFQRPLIQKAKEMGLETHVFAWREGATGAEDADFFYEISITEKEKILEIARGIKPAAVATIGSDLANVTVAYLAESLGLPGNGTECAYRSTNKGAMREAFWKAGIPTPFFRVVGQREVLEEIPCGFPVVVKPTDRSGSRAITKVFSREELKEAVERAIAQSFEKKAIVEEYLSGAEYSVETISFEGVHHCLAITKKFTTGAPHYIEVGHLQPAPLCEEMKKRVEDTVFQALNALGVRYGAGHSELRIDGEGNVRIVEIGSRMGGDCIGSDLVPLSAGWDFVKMVIETALGEKPDFTPVGKGGVSAIRFLMNERDLRHLQKLERVCPGHVVRKVIEGEVGTASIVDSGSRPGFYILRAEDPEEMEGLLHEGPLGTFGTEVSVEEALDQRILVCPTPIQKLNMEQDGNHFYMKRDDLLPFSFGGNKVRFARKFLKDMEEQRCDSMIIYGNYHSNLCRILATLCHQLSIPCYMVHNTEDIKDAKETNNSRIIKSMGVVEIPCGKQTIAQAVSHAMEELRERGFRPYYIYGNPRGQGREWVPMEAYEEAYEEICVYEREKNLEFDYIFLASSTNATQSGLLAGKLDRGGREKIVGISVSRNEARGREVIAANLREYAEKHGRSLLEGFEKDIYFTDAYQEGGYGIFSPKVCEVIRRCYEQEGVYLDMTYTGKGFYGMIEYLKEHGVTGKKILFLHTGGAPLFFDFLLEEKP